MMTRRDFLMAATGSSALSLTAFSAFAADKASMGVQLFSIPKMVDADLPGTLKTLSDLGYKEIEFFGPYDFSAAETIDGWKQVADRLGIKRNAFYGHSTQAVADMLRSLKLHARSLHLDMISFRTQLSKVMDAVGPLKPKYLVLPVIREPAERSKLDDYKKLADEFNAIGEKMSAHGMQFTYHNHGFEHKVMEGEVPMDLLLKRTDPRYVAFEMDIFWLTAAGASPVDYLNRYPGRFKLMHVKNAMEPVRFSGDGGTGDQWFALFSKMADPGSGVFDIPGIIKAGRKAGVEVFYLERDNAPEPMKTLTDSAAYLSKVLKAS